MTAPELNARYLLTKAQYDEACRKVIVHRDTVPADDLGARTHLRVLDLLQQVCDAYECELDELESRAAGAVADARAERRSRYDDSFAQLHANGRCRSAFCCGVQDAS